VARRKERERGWGQAVFIVRGRAVLTVGSDAEVSDLFELGV
jgi:hypothetical protein